MEAEQVIKRSLAMQLIALFLFLIICGLFALPTLTVGGDICGDYKTALVLFVFCWLAWRIYRHAFRFRDYFIYFTIVICFCYWADYELYHKLTMWP